jgi:GMP synthase (glutamine-hydrolysing)
MKRSAVVLCHVAFEDLDALDAVIRSNGFDIRYIETPVERGFQKEALAADLLIVLGGPIGVYQGDRYPFLTDEIAVVRTRLEADMPVLGICLGAQIMAAALGANVYPGTNGKEIGWSALQLTPAGFDSPLKALIDGQSVLNWHGDTFDLPKGAQLLASSARYEHQAFSYGNHGLALQFHLEASASGLERWYVGHTGELFAETIDVNFLRAQSERCAPIANAVLGDIVQAYVGRLGALSVV